MDELNFMSYFGFVDIKENCLVELKMSETDKKLEVMQLCVTRPPHLAFLAHAAIDELVDGGFDVGRGYWLPVVGRSITGVCSTLRA